MVSFNQRAAGIAAVGAAAAAIGLSVAQSAQADDATPTPSPTATQSGSATLGDPGKTDRRGRGHAFGHAFGPGGKHVFGFGVGHDLSELATKLGVEESKLQAALEAIRGDLKPELKDLKRDLKDGTPPTEDELKALRDSAKQTFADALAKELGIDAAKVKTALTELEAAREAEAAKAFSDHLAQAVKDGKLTQAEADAVKKAADAGVIPRFGGGPGFKLGPR